MVETATYAPGPDVRAKFRREIEQLLAKIPAEQWADHDLRGVLYEFVPWHRMSSVTIQTRDDRSDDIAAWKYYFSAESDGSLIRDEYEAWHNEPDSKRLVYHKLLIEAAEAFLSIDFGKYSNPYWSAINRNFCLNKTFLLQVYDVDGTFTFNYCDYVIARRLETRG
ncbi:hypothetical protein GobsT_67230 [Gemmata obscuriglobus]|uniref:hypothetical protein n=1 Tax=Gemmata obscuriglobus TaxID=114 RepID=UPI0011CD2F06|nr:hypothetical protein [Gemmata obscuriglobus]QEG31876.1 hypothetical protein GobsT_67230 [Gemmata obscuriglobus]VTS11222.1 unnamed protein product [Gemmata obscuriglobus UQM 2246]